MERLSASPTFAEHEAWLLDLHEPDPEMLHSLQLATASMSRTAPERAKANVLGQIVYVRCLLLELSQMYDREPDATSQRLSGLRQLRVNLIALKDVGCYTAQIDEIARLIPPFFRAIKALPPINQVPRKLSAGFLEWHISRITAIEQEPYSLNYSISWTLRSKELKFHETSRDLIHSFVEEAVASAETSLRRNEPVEISDHLMTLVQFIILNQRCCELDLFRQLLDRIDIGCAKISPTEVNFFELYDHTSYFSLNLPHLNP